MKGIIRPEDLYTRQALSEIAGFGANTILEMDLSGVVVPISVAHRLFYRGSEVIEWILKHGKKGSKRTKSKQARESDSHK